MARKEFVVACADQAREIAIGWLRAQGIREGIDLGLPELHDRYTTWRVPVIKKDSGALIGEIAIDARSAEIATHLTTPLTTIIARLKGIKKEEKQEIPPPPKLINSVICGDCEQVLKLFPNEFVDLVFTSPPYFSAKPQHDEFLNYDDYLEKMRRVIKETHRVLKEGRFFVINVSPVLIPRKHRNAQSQRLAIPFDLHQIFTQEGFDFVDDIIWVKPEGAGWAIGRGRTFAKHRLPLMYKPTPITEYIIVYRKHTDKLIDWNLKQYPAEVKEKSRIRGNYERTNVWYIKPARHPEHPAVFPLELAERIILYYSFVGDTVLDPFAGVGTVGKAAIKHNRNYILIEKNPRYVEIAERELQGALKLRDKGA